MEDFRRFIKLGDDRHNVEEIVSYGLAEDEDGDSYLYIETSDDSYQYYEDDVDFDLEDKLSELDGLLLIRTLGHVDFKRRD